MGTFHSDKGELHGITVVVETEGPTTWVGRCDQVTERGVVLLDAERFDADADADADKEEWLDRAARFGVWGEIRHVVVPRSEVTSVSRLGDREPA